MIEQLNAAAEALDRGDPEPFVSLIAEENEWRGVSRGRLWWKQTPTWHGPEEAREVLSFQLQKRNERIRVPVEFTEVGYKIIGSTEWLAAEGRRPERFQVLTVRDGKIVDMQGCSLAGKPSASRRATDTAAVGLKVVPSRLPLSCRAR
jgi:ketosteroid isomerase-like protein